MGWMGPLSNARLMHATADSRDTEVEIEETVSGLAANRFSCSIFKVLIYIYL